MNAAVVRALGHAPRCEQFPDPVASSEDEVVVQVHAAALKPVDRQLASGSHYAASRSGPFICGTDGVGRLADGRRVFFGGCPAPYGAMAQLTLVPKAFTFPVPENVDDEQAAAVPNPGISAWLALTYRAKLAAGETVLILGATGVAGKLAVQVAKLLGASRVVAAGRNQQILDSLGRLGANRTIQLDAPVRELQEAFAREAGDRGFQVVIDYLWGQPTEAFLAAITSKEFAAIKSETRLVQIGEGAGATISLPAAVLRSTAITILGTAGIPSFAVLTDAYNQVMMRVSAGELHIDTERVALADIESAWSRNPNGRRLLVIP
jgi:NADPH:quinone reductase-like Zn-dependent oxidoreductase